MAISRFFKAKQACVAVVVLVLSATAPAAAQGTGTIRGVVRDAGSARPIAGVQIYVIGSRIVGETNEEGRYELPNVPVGTVNVGARLVGYSGEVARIALTATLPADLDFEMKRSVIELDVVVVTGTGAAMELKQLGNTVGLVDMERIATAPVLTFSEALAAREPGVTVNAAGGLAGAGARIRIRGSNSLSLSNEPVVILDGVIIDNGGGMTNVGSGAAGPSRLDDINPDAIDRIEILKGAAASTLYGSLAGGGVIQIFTKSGRQGAPRFSFRVEQGISQYPDVYKPNSGFARDQAQADRVNEVYGGTPGWTDVAPYEVFQREFVKDLFETGRQQVYSLNVTGGSEAVNYFVAGRLSHDNGPLGAEFLGPARDVNRKIQGNANITVFPRERLSFRIGTLFTDTRHELPQNGNNIFAPISLAQFGKPELARCDDADGDGSMDISSQLLGGTTPVCESTGNPTGNRLFATTRETMQATTTQRAEHFNGNVTVSYQAAQSLSIEGRFGIDVTNSRDEYFWGFGHDVDHVTTADVLGVRRIGSRNNREVSFGLSSNWSTRFWSSFSSQFTTGLGGLVTTNETTGVEAIGFPGPGVEVVGAASNQSAFENWFQVVGMGMFAQEQIGLYDYIFLTVGARWGRQSTFGENAGATLYPKASLSIIPSDMPAWTSTLLSTVRLRGAFGRAGMQPGAYDKFTTYGPGTTWEGAALIPDNLGNEDLAPEVSTEWEVGAELGLFDNRVGTEVTYWNRVTTDALVLRQFPLTGGFATPQLDNIGELRGQGFELSFDWLVVDAEKLSVSVFAAASFIKERITSMGTAPPIKLGGSYPRYRNYLMPPIETSPGDTTYYAPGAYFGAALVDYVPGSTVPFDTDSDGLPDSEATFRAWLTSVGSVSVLHPRLSPLIRDDDRDGDYLDTYLGKPTPDWTGSFGATFTLFRNLDINSLFEFKTGNFYVTNLTDAFRNGNPWIGTNTPAAARVEATLLDPSTGEDAKFAAAMEWATELKALAPHAGMNTMENARFLRLRELGATWRAPGVVAARFGLSSLSISLAGRNLLKFDGYSGIDQESNVVSRTVGSGIGNNFAESIDAFGLPLPRRFTLSVQFGF